MRIGIVNDLALAREVLRRVVAAVPGYSVAWMAEDGAEAVVRTAADRPNVVLMDLIMPRLDGVEATRQIMAQSPCPVVVVTASVATNYAMACRAMGAGALDAVDTPVLGPGGAVQNADKLLTRLAHLRAALAGIVGFGSATAPRPCAAPIETPSLVLLGASTGGPEALATVLSAFPADLPAAVLISQHIGADFAHGLVQQLAARCKLPVRAAHAGDAPTAGVVHVAVSNDHMELGPDRSLQYTPHPREHPYRPSVDVLFTSGAVRASRPGVAALLTGMHTDGAEGLLRLRMAGWHTIAQDEATSVVYGMPKAAAEKRAAVEVLPLQHIGDSLVARLLALRRR
ncbi:chemotaxis-specific protein-glutamate methyltransferase CheB [Frigoriglobus tundricola]|uniref:Protein-glutamate methylesterase/protein-glutamine glutaminase n=1 Tax=Frigoriglobus tundricola TaxID=2774151 RepID=A0A6M5YUC0_9BACT|nr:chemotaxis-specific protein-glutamate methyltransferase CheB [Frigoriglobus tundricola]QJW97687.1 Chemotaxis response regulator protein-glutamate methylesterase CheB [Frigoriglobus tundricola]